MCSDPLKTRWKETDIHSTEKSLLVSEKNELDIMAYKISYMNPKHEIFATNNKPDNVNNNHVNELMNCQ